MYSAQGGGTPNQQCAAAAAGKRAQANGRNGARVTALGRLGSVGARRPVKTEREARKRVASASGMNQGEPIGALWQRWGPQAWAATALLALPRSELFVESDESHAPGHQPCHRLRPPIHEWSVRIRERAMIWGTASNSRCR